MLRIFFALLLLLFLQACPPHNDQLTGPVTFFRQSATVEMHIASRGLYQYLLVVPTDEGPARYYTDELPDKLKQDGLRVIFSGTVLADSATVFEPGANDVPQAKYKVAKVALKDVEEEK